VLVSLAWLLVQALSIMADAVEKLESLALSAVEIKELTNWPPEMIEDYLSILRNIIATATEIDINTAQIEINKNDIAQNSSDIAQNASDISTNASNIATNTSNIATNTSNISTNTANIGTNSINIATNTSDIATILSAYLKSVSESDGVATFTDESGTTDLFVTEQSIVLNVGSAQSVDSLTHTAIDFNSDIKDATFTHTDGTSTITVNADGRYRIQGCIGINGTTANYRYTGQTQITVNTVAETRFIDSGYIRATGGANESSLMVGDTIDLSNGDDIEVTVARISSTTGNAVTTVDGSWIEITRIQ